MRIDTILKPIPHGALRQRFGFLWLPKKIGAQWRWLEYAGWEQRRVVLDDEHEPMAYWENTRWLPSVPTVTRKGPSA